MNATQIFRFRSLLVAGALLLAAAMPCYGLTVATWTGGGSNNWSDAAEWNTSNFPDNGNDGDTWDAVINSGATVTLDQAITIETFDFNGGTISNSGFTLTTNQQVQWGTGSSAFLTGTGTLDANGGVSFGSNGGANPATRNSWVINLYADSDYYTGNGWFMENTGTINVKPGVTFDHQGQSSGGGGGISSTGIINNEGTYERTTNTLAVTVSNQFNNMSTGQVNVISGNLTLNGGGTQDGDFSISAGKTLTLSGTHTVNSTVAITGAGNFSAGNVTFNDGSSINIGGDLTIATIPTFNSSTTTLVGGNLLLFGSGNGFGGTGDITVSGNFQWSAAGGNTVNGTGKLTVMDGLQLTNSNGNDVNSKTIDLYGTSFLNSWNGWTMTNNGTINIKSGSFDYQSMTNVTSARLFGTGTINNEGLFFRSETSIAGRIDNTFNNIGGTLRADASTELDFTGPFSQTSGTTLIDGGTISITGTPSFTGGSIEGGNGGSLIADVDATGGGTGLTISPGQSTDTLSITGNVTLDGNDAIAIEIAGTNQGAAVNGYDFLDVTGTLDLGGATLDLSLLDEFKPGSSDVFTILQGTSVSGTFGNAGAGFFDLGGGQSFEVTYTGTSVLLSNFIQVPEPASLGLVAGCIGLAAMLRRRRFGRS